jgi:hypothetical protein
MYLMHVIEVREWGEGGALIELGGEFDGYNLEDLRQILDSVVELGGPTMVDLSGVVFLDVGHPRADDPVPTLRPPPYLSQPFAPGTCERGGVRL